MKKVRLGSFLGLVFVMIGASIVALSGVFPIAASSPPDAIDELAESAGARAIRRHARSVTTVPGETGPAAIARGLSHYRENCLPCHGAPGTSAAEFSAGLNPGPPPLEIDKVQSRPDNEIFWIVKNGIRMTGMPAFNINHKDDEIGDIVRFVRHLPKLSEEEKALLAQPSTGEDHHH